MFKATALSLLARVQRIFSIYHKTLVHIEGGLGSQILGVIAFWERQERYGIAKARCDLSYFRSPSRGDLWNWELDPLKRLLQLLGDWAIVGHLHESASLWSVHLAHTRSVVASSGWNGMCQYPELIAYLLAGEGGDQGHKRRRTRA